MKLLRDYQCDAEKLEQLYKRIFDYLKENPEDIDIEDVNQRIKAPIGGKNEDLNNNKDANDTNLGSTDWMLKRFLIQGHRSVDEAFDKFLEFFRFRKQYDVSKLTFENSISDEMDRLHAIERVGLDRQGNEVFMIRLKYYKKIPQLDIIIKRAILYYFEQFDLKYEQYKIDGICLVIDAQSFGLTNMDLDILNFVVKQVPFSYYGLVRNVLVYELPLLLSSILKVVESWLPTFTDKNGQKQKWFASCSKKTINDFIEPEQRPPNLNGVGKYGGLEQNKKLNFMSNNDKLNNDNDITKLISSKELINICGIKDVNKEKIIQHVDQLILDNLGKEEVA